MRARPPLRVGRASTHQADARDAARELIAQLGPPPHAGAIVYADPAYPLGVLGDALRDTLGCTVIGCTTAGQLDRRGFQRGGATAVSLSSEGLRMRAYLVSPLEECESRVLVVAERAKVDSGERAPGWHRFGILLVDGLSRAEERLTATLYHACEGLPIVGGSAGDDLAFRQTHVYVDGEVRSGAAVFAVVDTVHPFSTFKFQHVIPTPKKLVITAADAERRVVHEIDGEPATTAYARLIGRRVPELDATVYAQNPLVLDLAGDHFVRAVRSINDDGSITFFCAIEAGLVLSLGSVTNPITAARRELSRVSHAVGTAAVVLGYDCVLRRLELERVGLAAHMGQVYAEHDVVGFSTYGEQYNAMHVNQTFAGIALGA